MVVRGNPDTELEEKIVDRLSVLLSKSRNGTVDLSIEARKLISLFIEYLSTTVDREITGKFRVSNTVDLDAPTVVKTEAPKGIYLPFTLAKEVEDRNLRMVLSLLNVCALSVVVSEEGK